MDVKVGFNLENGDRVPPIMNCGAVVNCGVKSKEKEWSTKNN